MSSRYLHLLFIFCVSGSIAWANGDLYVSRHPAKILPQSIATISTPEAGEVRILTSGEGRLDTDTPIALLNEDKLMMEEREAELYIRQQRHDCNKAVLRLRKQQEELLFLKQQPQERRAFAQERLKTTVDEHVLSTLEEEIAITEERFRLSEEQKRQVIDKKRKASMLNMPFHGRIQLHIPQPKSDSGSVTLPGNTPVATVIDDSAYYVVIAATDPSWSKLDHSRLHVVVDLGGGEKLRAPWHHQKVDKADRGEALFYYFRLPEGNNDKAFSLLGSNIVAELLYQSEDNWVYISKAALAREAGARIIETWEKLVNELRPGHTIVFVGETHLCLRKTDECKDIPAAVPAP